MKRRNGPRARRGRGSPPKRPGKLHEPLNQTQGISVKEAAEREKPPPATPPPTLETGIDVGQGSGGGTLAAKPAIPEVDHQSHPPDVDDLANAGLAALVEERKMPPHLAAVVREFIKDVTQTNSTIAASLGKTANTVKSYFVIVFLRLGVENRTQLLATLVNRGLAQRGLAALTSGAGRQEPVAAAQSDGYIPREVPPG